MYAETMRQGVGTLGGSSMAAQQTAATGYGQDTAARQLEIPAGLERLDRQIGGLAEFVAMLDDRLTGRVARSQPPSPEKQAGSVKAVTQCGVGGHLDSLGDHVQGLRERLGSLLDRLEV